MNKLVVASAISLWLAMLTIIGALGYTAVIYYHQTHPTIVDCQNVTVHADGSTTTEHFPSDNNGVCHWEDAPSYQPTQPKGSHKL